MTREEAQQRQEQINKIVRKTQMPQPEITPQWMTEGIQNTYDYWDRLADIWEDLYPREGDHEVVAQLIPETDAPLEILDVGCGPGQVWEFVFPRAPNARMTGIDLCPRMLELVRARFPSRSDQITLRQGSCLEVDFGHECFDYVIGQLFVHFFSTDNKREIYRRVHAALRSGGAFLSEDLLTDEASEVPDRFRLEFVDHLPGIAEGRWNFKQTMSVTTKTRLLEEAGFTQNRIWCVGNGQYGVSVKAA